MSEYIDKSKLYEEIAELEEVARHRYLNLPNDNLLRDYYLAQMNERTNFKHLIMDFESKDVEPVKHGEWLSVTNDKSWAIRCSECGRMFDRFVDGCLLPKYCFCGAKMDKDGVVK